MSAVVTLEDFTNKEIEDEYFERFGEPDAADISDFKTRELIQELEERGEYTPAEAPTAEIIDLIAEAARTSAHARRAYNLIREEWPDITSLEARQMLIAGRMREVAA